MRCMKNQLLRSTEQYPLQWLLLTSLSFYLFLVFFCITMERQDVPALFEFKTSMLHWCRKGGQIIVDVGVVTKLFKDVSSVSACL
jgi:hypothetical protein